MQGRAAASGEAAAERIPPQFPLSVADFRSTIPNTMILRTATLWFSVSPILRDMSAREFDQKLWLKPVDTSELKSVR